MTCASHEANVTQQMLVEGRQAGGRKASSAR